MSKFLVAFVGLPSSGKSSIANSLLFKRLLQSGVCRTTVDATIIEDCVTDYNKNLFKILNLHHQ